MDVVQWVVLLMVPIMIYFTIAGLISEHRFNKSLREERDNVELMMVEFGYLPFVACRKTLGEESYCGLKRGHKGGHLAIDGDI